MEKLNVAIADGQLKPTGDTTLTGPGAVTGIDNLTSIPSSKVDSTYSWTVTYNKDGVKNITLGASGAEKEIYPDAPIIREFQADHPYLMAVLSSTDTPECSHEPSGLAPDYRTER